ncbi:hypothetical protein [Rhizobium leguminosarum]|uniref:hypothetical protein n=1 Tax=Rhizobium leguminosarum TaxID=384 RepID=UPI0010314219|nr:hypothetical protein [Rhizobium leguminosarum]TBG03776.1 hypothetical protein ELG82_09595 [Rhizobium leguminosarum]
MEDAERNAGKAAKAADLAMMEKEIAKRALHVTRLAGKRVDEIVAVFDDRYPEGSISNDLAMRYARCLVSALLWEHRAEPSGIDITSGFVANVFPALSPEKTRSIVAENASMTNAEVGQILQVTLGDVERLSLSMITPFDVTPEEFKTYREERQLRRDRIRKAEAARVAGKPTIEERRAMQAEKKAELEALAKALGKSVAQIRRDIKAGKIPTEAPNAKLGSVRDNNRTEFTFASSVPTAAGAFKAPPAHASDRDSDPSAIIAAELLSSQERRGKIAQILFRAAETVRVAS